MLQGPGDLDGAGFLDNIIPLLDGLGHLCTLLGLDAMLDPQMRGHLLGVHAIFAAATYDNLQTGDSLKKLVFHGAGLKVPAIYISCVVVADSSGLYEVGIWINTGLKLDLLPFFSMKITPGLVADYTWLVLTYRLYGRSRVVVIPHQNGFCYPN